MLVYEAIGGEKIQRKNNTIFIKFPGLRKVLSNSRVNGGLRDDLEAVFNHGLPPEKCHKENLPNGSVEDYMRLLMEELGFSPDRAAGMLTAARMENVSIKEYAYKDLSVAAIVTGGIDINGGRVGDPASYYEINGEYIFRPGTINTILLINGGLPSHTLVRAVVTATEAKTAALQELMAPSKYSSGIATGSGTDQIIVVANPLSEFTFNDAGKHSKLGELIGITVKEAVKEALFKETGLGSKRQHSFLARLNRFGITEDDFWQEAVRQKIGISRDEFDTRLSSLAENSCLVALAACITHLLDEYEWGLLSSETVKNTADEMIGAVVGQTVSCPRAQEPKIYLTNLFIKMVVLKIFCILKEF